MTNIITRVKDIVIGTGSITYTWNGIRSINFGDTNPWEHIEIPGGTMIHQHLHSPHVKGEIKCYDLNYMYTALYLTAIDNASHAAIDDNATKYAVDYLLVEVVNEKNEVVSIILDNFRIETISVGNIELGKEAEWIVKFSADIIVFPVSS